MATRSARARAVGVLIAITTTISSIGAANLAHATVDDPGIATLRTALTDVGAWTSALASVGKLAQPIPTVGRSAGSVLGFPDLVTKAVANQLATIQSWGNIDVNRTLDATDLGPGRTGALKTTLLTVGTTRTLSVELDATATLTNEPFSFASASPALNLNSTGGMKVTGNAHFTFAVAVEQTEGASTPSDLTDDKYAAYVVRTATSPALSVDVSADLPDAPAGLSASIGILGVTATETTPDAAGVHDASVHLTGTLSDPDGDGRLYFTKPDGGVGELGDPATRTGLINVGFAASGAGNVDIALTLTATVNSAMSLPAVNSNVTIVWPNIATGSPTVTATGLSSVQDFMSLSPRDLADMLGQLVSIVTAAQRANGSNLNLPFLSGTLADAVKGSETLVDFLEKNIVQPAAPGTTTDPARVGQPSFISIQDLIAKLQGYTGTGGLAGANITVAVGNYLNNRLPIDLAITRTSPAFVDMVKPSVAASGTATYGAKTLKDATKTFTSDFVGRRVVAGSAGGTVASVAGDTLTMSADWSGGQPDNSASYTVSGPAVDAGAVNLANLLGSGGKGIKNANAIRPTAKVKVDYTINLKFALDLSPVREGAACLGATGSDPAGTISCPYERTNADGSHVIVTQEPLPVERLLVKTGYDLLTADFPIDAGVDVYANAGFLKVKLAGTVKACKSSAAADCSGGSASEHMITVALKPHAGDAYMPVAEFFRSLVTTPADRLTVNTKVRGYVSGNVTVPDAADFLPGGATAGFSASWADIGTGTPVVNVTGLSDILAFDIDATNPAAMLGVVLRVLQKLDDESRAGGGSGILGQQIPLVDRSLRDFLGSDESGGGLNVSYGTAGTGADARTTLTDATRTGGRVFPAALAGRSVIFGTQVGVVGSVSADGKTLTLTTKLESQPADGTVYTFRSELADAISMLTATPPDSLQQLIKVLDARLGGDLIHFRHQSVSGVGYLVIDTKWHRAFNTEAPIKLNLGGSNTIAGAKGTGTAKVDVLADIDVDLAVPLAIPAGGLSAVGLKILDSSHIGVEAHASVAGDISANLGPLSLSLGKPGDPIDAKAEARYSLGFQKASPAGTLTTLSDFLSSVAPVVNGYAGGVDCGEAASPTDADLALCASLPLFVSADGTTYTPVLTPIAMRLPKVGASVSQLFSPSGNVSATDTRARLSAPSAADIATAFRDALLNFGLIGDGIDAFLTMVESSLNEASMQGKLPVVGQDLQAGTDFVGDVRTQLKTLFTELKAVNGGRLPDVATVQSFLDTKFRKALTDAGANPENFQLKLTCKLPSSNVATVTTAGTAGTTTYKYGVIAVGTSGASFVDTALGDTKDIATGNATLDGTNFNTITWTSVSNAAKYKVLRWNDTTSKWDVLTTTTGTSFDDKGVAAESPNYTPPPDAANTDTCTGISLPDVQGVVLRVDIGTGSVNGTDGCADAALPAAKKCITNTIPVDIGIPGLSLRAAKDGAGGGVTAKVGWNVHLALELDRAHGLSILTKDQGKAELGVGLNVDLTAALRAELAFLKVDISKVGTGPAFAAAFQVDIKSGAGEASCFLGTEGSNPGEPCAADPSARLGFAEFASASHVSELIAPRFDLKLHINWLIKATADAALPGIQTRLVMDWDKVLLDPAAEDGTGLTIAFEDVAIDTGKFLSDVLGPIVKEVKKVTGPTQPIIDTLYAPIPVLSDLSKLAGGPDITIVTLAKAFSTVAGGPKLDFVDTIASVITFVNNLPTPDGTTNLLIPVGSFEVTGTAAFSTPATPETGASLIKPGSRKYKTGAGATTTDPTQVGLRTTMDSKSKVNGAPSTAMSPTAGAAKKSGFAFPLLDNPSSIFGLIMGQDVDLVTFDSGPLTLGFSWRQAFGPVYAPPPVFITLSGSASVTAHIVAGFDTYGLRKAFEQPVSASSIAGILDGLYFKSTNDDGTPLPVVTFYGEIAAGAAVSAVILTVGIEGGVSLTIAMSWNDPDGDGKFRLFEFGRVALNNPICLFQMSGRIGLFLRVYITIGYSPFSVSFSFTLADITLLDFSVTPNCDPPPPRLGGVSGDTLVVFAGKFGQSHRGNAAWYNNIDGYGEDVIKVIQLHKYAADGTATKNGVKIEALGISETWEGGDFANINRVVVDGRGYDRKIKLTMIGDGDTSGNATATNVATGDFTMDAVVIGGSANDTVKTGSGRSLIDLGAGDDTLSASDTPAAGRVSWIAGGPGADSISGGDADSIVAGDGALDADGNYPERNLTVKLADGGGDRAVNGIVDWTQLVAPGGDEFGTDGGDRIAVGLGANTTYGNGGDDAVGVAADSELAKTRPAEAARWTAKPNTIVLGTGSDSAKGGSNDDTIWTATRTSAVRTTLSGGDGVDTAGAADTGAVQNNVDTGTGSDTVFGGTAVDYVTGGSTSTQADHFRGGGGDDVLLGGFGTDELFGGPGRDWVIAEPAVVGAAGAADAFGVQRDYQKTDLPAGTVPSSKLLVGGDGADRVVGGDGGARIFGDRYETTDCASGATGSQPQSTAPDEPSAGSPGRDLILGGSGVDKVKAGGAADRIEAYSGDDLLCGQAGNDEIFAADGADKIWAGSGNDRAYGDSGADDIYGNDGVDQLFGGDGGDSIEGNNGADTVYGGTGDDTIHGGSRAAGLPDDGDTLYGDDGADRIIGDNGDGTAPVDLDGANLTLGGPDLIFGGIGDDVAFGGLAADVINGGIGDDHLEGNHGIDVIHGDAGEDQIIGGSSQLTTVAGVGRPDERDDLFGDDGNDVITGDNAVLTLDAAISSPLLAGRGFNRSHSLTLLDLGVSTAGTFGGDTIRGGAGNDVLLGQSGNDVMFGETGDDYAEGNQGDDSIEGAGGVDDLIGGSSTLVSAGVGQPDGGDKINAGDDDDVVLGDNGSVLRTGPFHPVTDGRAMTRRSISLYDLGTSPTAGTSAGDTITGGTSADVLFGQGGADDISGNSGDDYIEGNQDSDLINGGADGDDLLGGSSTPVSPGVGQPDGGDVINGGNEGDVVLGDNGSVLRVGAMHPLTVGRGITTRAIALLDLGATPAAGTSDADLVNGGDANDVIFGQGGADRLKGNNGDDYVEGGQGADWIEGAAGDDDLVGGGYTPAGGSGELTAGQSDTGDVIFGGAGDDVATGDNAQVLRGTGVRTKATDRTGTSVPGARMTERQVTLLDRRAGATFTLAVPSSVYGADRISGGEGVDVAWGQDGNDFLSGGAQDDYLEGNGGSDQLRGDAELTAAGGHFAALAAPVGVWPGSEGSAVELLGTSTTPGQDDLIGGSTTPGFRDGDDQIEGNGESDVELGDNGSLVRTVGDTSTGTPFYADSVYAERYPTGAAPANATKIRSRDTALPGPSTRFCTTAQPTCEVVGAFGADTMYGDGGDDGMWGQDGNDIMRGGDNRDDMFGELGDDTLYGDAGEDAILGDRGGVRNEYLNNDAGRLDVSLNSVPKETYAGRVAGQYDRRVDLLHDTDGSTWVGTSSSTPMAHPGLLEGGNDRIRGGDGDDQIHAGWGEDLANGDSGGDEVFGDDGADVLWGGKGCAGAECPGGDESYRGVGDKYVDHIFGGRGALSESVGVLGADILDWAPRPGACSNTQWPVDLSSKTATTSQDPCGWFEMTDTNDADPSNNQHHHGTDWIYGGWDRDIMQADVAANGPNPGDRLLDWNGAYNLYSHCNAAYGGFNDVRQHSPAMNDFLLKVSAGSGAGQGVADTAVAGTSAYRELAYVYNTDNSHAAGRAFPGTPGHFDAPVACSP